MKKIAIVGAGVSGLTCAQVLKDNYYVRVYEKESTPGGLIRCKKVDGSLFHLCGGHVFNSKRQDVLDWFWSRFDKDNEFVLAHRNAAVFIDGGRMIKYPIENHIYGLNEDLQKSIINDWMSLNIVYGEKKFSNFKDFLINRFGRTLYDIYFRPYNEKIWNHDLSEIPMDWLYGKLPMPTVSEMIYNNINHVEENSFVHSSFWYEKNNGSQFIADRLSRDIDVLYDTNIDNIICSNECLKIHDQCFDGLLFCGNIKELISMIRGVDLSPYYKYINSLQSHGTTTVFCEVDPNVYSWCYLPSELYRSHRIICTGNFSKNNNAYGKMTASIEFSNFISKDDIIEQLKLMPLRPVYIAHHYNKFSYPVQDLSTRNLIYDLKNKLKPYHIYITGRFADWEYYNMDMAIGAAMDTCDDILKKGL